MIGFDIGTDNIVMYRKGVDGKETRNSIKNCYYTVPQDDEYFLELAKKGELSFAERNGEVFVFGIEARSLANGFNATVQRPMQQGVINPLEDNAAEVLNLLISSLAGKPAYPGEVVVASIPAPSNDGEIDTVVHEDLVADIFENLGYNFKAINEGLAGIYAENPVSIDEQGEKHNFTGIYCTAGAGLMNWRVAYRGKDIFGFSLNRSGDWVDDKVSQAMGVDKQKNRLVSRNEVQTFKEKYLDLQKTWNEDEIKDAGWKTPDRISKFKKLQRILKAYYKDLITYAVSEVAREFSDSNRTFDEKLEIVLSGGTSMPNGYEQLFAEVLGESTFPVEIYQVRKAANPLDSTAKGALVLAISHEKKLGIKAEPEKTEE